MVKFSNGYAVSNNLTLSYTRWFNFFKIVFACAINYMVWSHAMMFVIPNFFARDKAFVGFHIGVSKVFLKAKLFL